MKIVLSVLSLLLSTTAIASDLSDWTQYDLSGNSSYSVSNQNGSSSASNSSDSSGSSSSSYFKKDIYRAAADDAALYIGGMEPTFLLQQALNSLKDDLRKKGYKGEFNDKELALFMIEYSR